MNSLTTGHHRFLSSFCSMKQLLLMSDILVFFAICGVSICFGPRNWLWIVGLVTAGVGFSFWMVARRQLGASFMLGAAAKELVTTGLYRRFRHPIYLFGGLATVGAFLALQNWWLLFFWLAYATPIQWAAPLRKEDSVLKAEFGEAFLQLRSSTWI